MKSKDITTLLEILKIGKITVTDQWINGQCPFAPFTLMHKHKVDRRPSFGISVGGNSHYYCFTCHASGPVMMLVTALSFKRKVKLTKARRFVANHEKFELEPFEDLKDELEPLHVLPEGMLDRFDALDRKSTLFLKSRRMRRSTAEHFELSYDSAQNRLIIPVRNHEGFLVGFRGRALFEGAYAKYRAYVELNPQEQDPKRHGVWYGQDSWPDKGKKLIITEGELDAMMLWQVLKRPVWASMGAQISREQIKSLKTVQNPIVLWMDNDEAGKDAGMKLAKRVKKFVPGIYKVTEYYGFKDPAEIVKSGGKDLVRKCLESLEKIN